MGRVRFARCAEIVASGDAPTGSRLAEVLGLDEGVIAPSALLLAASAPAQAPSLLLAGEDGERRLEAAALATLRRTEVTVQRAATASERVGS